MRSLCTQVTAGGDQCYLLITMHLPATTIVIIIIIVISALMLSTRDQTGLETKILASASASTSWPQHRAFGPGLALVLLTWPRKMCLYLCKLSFVVSVLWLYHCNFLYKDVVKHSDVGHKFIYVQLTLLPCVLIQKYLHVAGLDLGLGLEDSASWFWPRPRPQLWPLRYGLVLTSLYHCPFQFALSQLCPPCFQTGRS